MSKSLIDRRAISGLLAGSRGDEEGKYQIIKKILDNPDRRAYFAS